MKNNRVYIIILCFLISINVYSWGSRGHKIVGAIAKKCLSQQVIDSVQYYLGDMNFEQACVWLDEIKSDASYDYMKSWHYINIEKDKTYVKVKEPNVVNQLELAITELKLNGKERAKEKIALALRLIFHLVGDLHQPLHAGYLDDRGGNSVKVDFMGYETNLHKVWDTEIIENANISTKKCLEYINTMPEKEKTKVQTINVISWLNESRLYLTDVYSFEKNKINKEYIEKNTPIIEKQLSKAGIRLASILYVNFKK